MSSVEQLAAQSSSIDKQARSRPVSIAEAPCDEVNAADPSVSAAATAVRPPSAHSVAPAPTSAESTSLKMASLKETSSVAVELDPPSEVPHNAIHNGAAVCTAKGPSKAVPKFPGVREVLQAAVLQRIAPPQLFFLDSTNLLDLRNLNQHIAESANYILLLSRATLTRPVVLVEVHRYTVKHLTVSRLTMLRLPSDQCSGVPCKREPC